MIESRSVASAATLEKNKAETKIIPRATYRLQFNEHFRLADALALVPYFHELGISHVYASPLFKAGAHSNHGYDVCDFGQVNPEIGTEEDLQKLVATLREFDMGLVLDIVPNHMGATQENGWWWDVLKHGRASRYADYFDIQWEPAEPELRGKIVVPILGDHYQRVGERGEFRLEREKGEPVLRYFEHKFPIAPDSISKDFSGESLNSDRAALDGLIQKQHYALIFWGEGDSKVNYRRFFAVSTLAAIRVEENKVFNDAHALLKKWLDKKWLDGVRVDHPDGLREPKKYVEQLRALAPNQWIVVEKILQPGEEVPENWPVEGTVGYDFLNQLNGLFVDARSENALMGFYSDFTGEPAEAGKMVREKKRLVLETLFTTEINRLVDLLAEIAARRSAHQNFSREQLREAIIEYAAGFPIYRTYIRPREDFVDENDLPYIRKTTALAKESRRDLPAALFDFLNDLLLLLFHGEREGEFVARFQQLTGPAMAKGVEDTTFYCRNPFLSLNEVGSDPGKFGVSADEFHDFCRRLAQRSPHTMLGSSTHDTKRSEDVRARLNVLSEIPAEWTAAVRRWSKMNERHRKNHFPDRNIEYVLYQTLAGAWPISQGRLLAYMDKAACEAKQHTDWNHRNVQYDEALKNFVTAVTQDTNFIQDLEKFIASLIQPALVNSLAQTLIKLTAPGVPDIYQGNEIWDFSLVDPDNRRPVDFPARQRLLAQAREMSAEETWRRRDSGLPKLWLIRRTLALREEHEQFFNGDYEPVLARGENAEQVVAFVRGGGVMTVVPRFTYNRVRAMPVVPLPDGKWRNEFTRETFSGEVNAGDWFRKFPVALLMRETV